MTTTITFNNGAQIPAIGYGVFQTPPDETIAAVQAALEVGYRHIDTAAAYGNERQVGEAIRRSGLDRSALTVETKIWISDFGYDQTLHAFEKATGKLGLEHIDVLILHQALSTRFDLTVGAYEALESLTRDGRVTSIGVSNFMEKDLQALAERTSIVPALNQIEMHPYFQQRGVIAANEAAGIVTQAWSPIGGITFYPGWGDDRRSTLENRELLAIADRHGKTAAQVMLRWHLQQGRSVIPKSVDSARIAENFDVFDFELAEIELAAIDALEAGVRGGPDPDSVDLDSYGFAIPEA